MLCHSGVCYAVLCLCSDEPPVMGGVNAAHYSPVPTVLSTVEYSGAVPVIYTVTSVPDNIDVSVP